MMKVNKNTLNAIRGFLTLSTEFVSEMMQQRRRKENRTPIKCHLNLQMNTYLLEMNGGKTTTWHLILLALSCL